MKFSEISQRHPPAPKESVVLTPENRDQYLKFFPGIFQKMPGFSATEPVFDQKMWDHYQKFGPIYFFQRNRRRFLYQPSTGTLVDSDGRTLNSFDVLGDV